MDTAPRQRMPVAFFGHGSPTNVLEDNRATRTWAQMAARIGTPRAILCISAHWCTRGTFVTAMPQPQTIHDFGRSLPAPLFDQQYPAPGSPELAQRVQDLLAPLPVGLDQDWGLDHGTWSVLKKAWPHADIPVVQLSLDMTKPEEWHYALATQLRPLRNEGYLIMGSGNIVHNLGVLQWSDTAFQRLCEGPHRQPRVRRIVRHPQPRRRRAAGGAVDGSLSAVALHARRQRRGR